VPVLTFGDRRKDGYPVREQRFFLAGVDKAEASATAGSQSGWTIPVCVKSADCHLIDAKSAMLEVPPVPLFYANAAAKGYYRVAYSPAEVKALTAVAETQLSVPERIGFLGDRWALTRAGETSVGDYLDLALALKHDPNAQVLDSTLSTLAQIRSRIASDEDRPKLDAMERAEYGPIYAALGADTGGGSLDQSDIRTELFDALGEAGDPATLEHARRITQDLFSGKKITEPNIVDAAVALAAENGDQEFYERLLVVSQKATDPGLQSEAQELLTRFRDPVLVVRTLEYATSGQVRNQDSWILIAREISQRQTRGVAWPWVQQNWAKVSAQLTTASGSGLIAATGAFCTVAQRDEVKSFFAAHPVDAADRSLAKALDSIDECVKLRAIQEPKLKVWLASHPE
jgi:aminopeptidase N/puromycin-sensitive aminopeptidase